MNDFNDSGISAGAMAVIIVAAIAVLVGFMTLVCTAINFAKNRRRTRRLQSLSPVRIVTPAECLAAQNRRPVPLSANAAGATSILRFIPSVPTTPCDSAGSKPQSPKMFSMVPEAPPSYEEAMQMAIDESRRTATHQGDTHTPVLSQNVSNTRPVEELPSTAETEAESDNQPTTSYANENFNNKQRSSAASTHSDESPISSASTSAASQSTTTATDKNSVGIASDTTNTFNATASNSNSSASGSSAQTTKVPNSNEKAKPMLRQTSALKSFEDVDL
uniref:Uncharacterized protein n=1 Tax=Syphacia muris TaxID=451379 RepID=A0A0N5AA76_9BILA